MNIQQQTLKLLLESLEIIEKSDFPTAKYLHLVTRDKTVLPEGEEVSEANIHPLVNTTTAYANIAMTTSNGCVNINALSEIQNHGYKHSVLERDESGPLRCGITTTKGMLVYG